MAQPTPKYSSCDLDRIIMRDYTGDQREQAKSLLQKYGIESWHNEVIRVQLACLKCADRDILKLEYYLNLACEDYRDVLLVAEYPIYAKANSEIERTIAIQSDWKNLQEWFARK